MITTREVSQSEQRYISKLSETKAKSPMSSSDAQADPKQVAEYLADLLTGARDMATASGLTFLAYLVQVAVEEAKIQVSGDTQP